ncbi:hypothetical protein [Vampirovibrio sp.]
MTIALKDFQGDMLSILKHGGIHAGAPSAGSEAISGSSKAGLV